MAKSILIVDDEFGLADVIAEMLAELGYQVAVAINGRLGLEAMGRQRPDLLLVDLMMPIMGGQEMLRRVKADPLYRDIPVVLMTAVPAALPTDEPRLYAAVLNKPFSPDLLFETVERLLPGPAEAGA